MNAKTANLIALELGILIAIMAWLAFSNRSSIKPDMVAEEQERTAGSFATVAPLLKARNQPLPPTNYRADSQGGQSQGEEQNGTVQAYHQQIATAPYVSSDLADGYITESSPYYGVAPEPVVYPPACFVSPFDQIGACPQPNEIIIFSSVRSFGFRHRPMARFGGPPRVIAPHRRPGGVDFRAPGGGLVSPRNAHPRPSRPTRGIQGPPRSLARN